VDVTVVGGDVLVTVEVAVEVVVPPGNVEVTVLVLGTPVVVSVVVVVVPGDEPFAAYPTTPPTTSPPTTPAPIFKNVLREGSDTFCVLSAMPADYI
jgi:hypothetical protein